jgi:hypothetical protein
MEEWVRRAQEMRPSETKERTALFLRRTVGWFHYCVILFVPGCLRVTLLYHILLRDPSSRSMLLRPHPLASHLLGIHQWGISPPWRP